MIRPFPKGAHNLNSTISTWNVTWWSFHIRLVYYRTETANVTNRDSRRMANLSMIFIQLHYAILAILRHWTWYKIFCGDKSDKGSRGKSWVNLRLCQRQNSRSQKNRTIPKLELKCTTSKLQASPDNNTPMPNESPWLSTETIALDNAAATVKRGVRNVLTKFIQFALRDSVLEVSLGLMYVFYRFDLFAHFSLIFRIWFQELQPRLPVWLTLSYQTLFSLLCPSFRSCLEASRRNSLFWSQDIVLWWATIHALRRLRMVLLSLATGMCYSSA